MEAGYKNFYLGLPSWLNYIPMIETVGGKVNTYEYYNTANGELILILLRKPLLKHLKIRYLFSKHAVIILQGQILIMINGLKLLN